MPFASISPAELGFIVSGLLAAGAVTGVLAGLFGVGGGAIIVPILYETFRLLEVPEEVRMPLSVGTSLAIIVPTAIRSSRAHNAKGATDRSILDAWKVPVVLGVVLGSVIAGFADPWVFKLVFVLVSGANATKLLSGNDAWRFASDLPRGLAMRAYGFAIGVLSSLMGIGGGALCSMVMTLHGRPIHQAVATSAGLGVLIAVPGAIGYAIAGWGRPGLPPLSIGFVSLLGAALLVPTSLLTTRFGVNLAHALPKRALEIAFGLFLATVCLRFLVGLAT